MDLKQHDTAPSLAITLTDHDPITDIAIPVNLTTATSIKVIAQQDGAQLFSRTTTGDAAGNVTLPWQTGDTVNVGVIYIEVEVTWPGGAIQTFPPVGTLRVNVAADLG